MPGRVLLDFVGVVGAMEGMESDTTNEEPESKGAEDFLCRRPFNVPRRPLSRNSREESWPMSMKDARFLDNEWLSKSLVFGLRGVRVAKCVCRSPSSMTSSAELEVLGRRLLIVEERRAFCRFGSESVVV